MIQAIASESTITAYAALRPGMLACRTEPSPAIGASRTPVAYKFVSPEYFDVFDIPIVRGRTFTAAERDGEHPVVIVSESIARELWPNGGGVGETFRLEPDSGSEHAAEGRTADAGAPGHGRGRVARRRRFPVHRCQGCRHLPADQRQRAADVGSRRASRATPSIARRTLVDHLTKIDPDMGMVVTMRTLARLETFFLQIAFWVSLMLGGLALLLTVSGLFSVLSYLVEQRTREIGVRMALGASSRKVTQLILAQTTRPVVYGLLAGVGLAAISRHNPDCHAGRRRRLPRSCASPIRSRMRRACS